MNYERITKLAALLNQHHGEPDRHGFIVAPENELLMMEHKNALKHAGRLFDYQLVGTERLGILAVTKNGGQPGNEDYTHTRLEHMDHAPFTANPDISSLLEEYMEYKKSQITEY